MLIVSLRSMGQRCEFSTYSWTHRFQEKSKHFRIPVVSLHRTWNAGLVFCSWWRISGVAVLTETPRTAWKKWLAIFCLGTLTDVGEVLCFGALRSQRIACSHNINTLATSVPWHHRINVANALWDFILQIAAACSGV